MAIARNTILVAFGVDYSPFSKIVLRSQAIKSQLTECAESYVEDIENQVLKSTVCKVMKFIIFLVKPEMAYDNNSKVILPKMLSNYLAIQEDSRVDPDLDLNGAIKARKLIGKVSFTSSLHSGMKASLEKVSSQEVRAKMAKDPLLKTVSPLGLKLSMAILMHIGSCFLPPHWRTHDQETVDLK